MTLMETAMADADETPPLHPSLIDRLKEQRSQARPQHLDIPLPGWGGEEVNGIKLIARMKRIPATGQAAEVMRRFRKAATDDGKNVNPQLEYAAECDLLIQGCEQLMVLEPDSDEPVPADPDQPLRFDLRFAQMFGMDFERVREVVEWAFGGAEGQFAVKQAAGTYYRWLAQVDTLTETEGKG